MRGILKWLSLSTAKEGPLSALAGTAAKSRSSAAERQSKTPYMFKGDKSPCFIVS
jgi:hypothetical protein